MQPKLVASGSVHFRKYFLFVEKMEVSDNNLLRISIFLKNIGIHDGQYGLENFESSSRR